MSVLDPGLKFLQTEAAEASERLAALEGVASIGLESDSGKPKVKVLVRFEGDVATLAKAGLEVSTVAGDVVSGSIRLDRVDRLEKLPEVKWIELTRPLAGELNISMPEIRANLVHSGPPGNRGAGVLIGIIDSGIDVVHPSFRRNDGTTRILSIWDQVLVPGAGEANPAGFTFGVEYSDTQINASIAVGGPPNVVRHIDSDRDVGHGTHVSGIAAGDGSGAGNGQPAFTFVGVAPEADIIMVRNNAFGGGRTMGDSANTLDAVNYIFGRATALNRPVVINLSQGDNVGSHDGTSLLERGIDNLLGGQGRCMVKSAGNEGATGRHASGRLAPGETQSVRFNMPAMNTFPDVIDLWYDGPDRFGVTLTTPDGNTSAAFNPGTTTTLTLPNGNRVFVDSALANPSNGDNRIFLRFDPGTAAATQAGNWSLNVTGTTVTNGRFHSWIDRNIPPVPTFISHVDQRTTLSIPGTSAELITVGSYVTNGAGVGSLSTFSSRGPTRDGRDAPTIAAPGQSIMSARAAGIVAGTDLYHMLAGTSMATPHVTGTVALMLAVDRNLTQAQVADCLRRNARADAFTGAVPNLDWGAGKLDAKAAIDCVSPAKLKVVDDPRTLKFADDPTTRKFTDDPITFKVSDDPITLKFADDPSTLKFADDPTTLKVSDDPRTMKFSDDPTTLKFSDDPTTLKVSDDPRTLKFSDDPTTLKFGDDQGTDPRADELKQPSFDKPPGSDNLPDPQIDPRINPAINPAAAPRSGVDAGRAPVSGRGPAAPFVVSTPHHSNAWAESYPAAHVQAVAELETILKSYEGQIAWARAAAQAGGLSEPQMQQAEALYEHYQRLLAEHRQLTGR